MEHNQSRGYARAEGDGRVNYSGETASTRSTMTTPRDAIVAVVLLCLTNLVGYLDRPVLALMVTPIKASLHLSDGQMGLMLGPAFIFSYAIAGLFIGRLVDRVNRRNILMIAAGIWSLSTAAGGFASSGTHLFIARMGVGIGEASLFPVAVSLIADYFPSEKRGKPLGFYIMAAYCGNGLSLILTGVLLPLATSVAKFFASEGAPLEPWRVVLFMMVVPGIICCALLFRVKEPARRRDDVESQDSKAGHADWMAHVDVYLPLHLFMALVTLAMYAVTSWIPTVLIREYHVPIASAGFFSGSIIAITGILCVTSAGALSDRASKKGGATGPLLMTLFCVALGLPGFVMLWYASGPVVLMLGVFLTLIPHSMALLSGLASLSNLSPARSRGWITSVHFLLTGILGVATGPVLVGYVNDWMGGAASGDLGRVVSLVGIVSTVVAVLLAWLGMARAKKMARHTEFQVGVKSQSV
ncbi:MFS transporter [Paraburkholderia fynbosensis]|uniref:D-galactonate transporter n=1 Tax=Paraburkholderia fynbosensis TaxID=1200993 RepID=A0A6J5GZB4_9BURK|nr:MFS transporter [Paraburkholderia fynbosensis]CAB3809755.1 D-galactonate transporter [Paraburkholderia fynbosensis]